MGTGVNRREFLRQVAVGAAAATVGARAQTASAQAAGSADWARIAMVGVGNRGRGLLKRLARLPNVAVTAVCDLDEGHTRQAIEIVREQQGTTPVGYFGRPEAYRDMLTRDDVDGVLIATPTKWHCPMAIQAMQAGKHVGSEVPAGFTRDELWELVKAKEATGRRYMLLENYLYMRHVMMVYHMVRQGVFGDAYYAEGSYLHDCRFMLFKKDGTLDWWGDWASQHHGHDYPTHSLGPVSKWLALNEGDRMTHCSAMMSRPRVLKEYTVGRFGADSPQAGINWANGDMTCVMIQTEQGRLIRIDYDVNSPRPAVFPYLLQGTRGVYDSRHGIYVEGTSDYEKWQPVAEYAERYEHPYWRREGEAAAKAGHGGGDYFVLRDFADMVRTNREPWIDVYDGASWSVIYHCSRESIDRQGASVEVPDFTNGRWKDATWRQDHDRPA